MGHSTEAPQTCWTLSSWAHLSSCDPASGIFLEPCQLKKVDSIATAMLTFFIIGMTCLLAVQGEPEPEADPQFFYPNALPIYNNYYPRAFYPSIARTPLVQKAAVVQKTDDDENKAVKTPFFFRTPAATHLYPAYPTSAYYPQPFFRYTPLSYYPNNFIQFLQPSKPEVKPEGDAIVDDAEVVTTRDAMPLKPLRPIIPTFGNGLTRLANPHHVTFLRPNEAPAEPEIPDDNENLVQFRSLPYNQAYLNRIPVQQLGK